MYQRRPKRFRRRSNDRGYQSRGQGDMQGRLRTNSFSNGYKRNHFYSTQSAEKLVEKYNALAKEALAVGDKTLSENYLQHADHFSRMIEDKNKNQNQNKIQVVDKPSTEAKNLPENKNVIQEKDVIHEKDKEEKKE